MTPEVQTIREGAGLITLEPTLLRLGGDGAREALATLLPCDLRLIGGALRSALVLDEQGGVLADALVGQDEDDWILWVDGLSAEEVRARLPERADLWVEDLTPERAALSVEGPFAWDVLCRFDEPGVLAMPYLSFYRHPEDLLVLRVGRAGELAWQLLVPRPLLEELRGRLLEAGQTAGLRECGLDALRACARESWNLDLRAPGIRGLDPRELGLQWRLRRGSEAQGMAALAARPLGRRICAARADAALRPDAPVTFDGREVGRIRWCDPALHGQGFIAAVSLDLDLAFAHVSGFQSEGVALRTVTPPFVVPRSLWVRPDQHDAAQRDLLPRCAPSPEPFGP